MAMLPPLPTSGMLWLLALGSYSSQVLTPLPFELSQPASAPQPLNTSMTMLPSLEVSVIFGW